MKGQRTKADSLEAFRVPERSEPASGRHPAPDQTPRCLHEKHSRPCVFRALGSLSDAVVRRSEANVPGELRSEGGRHLMRVCSAPRRERFGGPIRGILFRTEVK